MKRQYLDGQWHLQNERIGCISAQVPGCVHTDLIANGVINDIFWRDNNSKYQWIENCDWDYECSFNAETGKNVSLIFEGLDTYAEIYLNDKKLGETDDMFVPHKFDVSSVLKEQNNLRVHFRSPIKEVDGKPTAKGNFTTERMNSRRIQCTYGWDWVDRFVTCGIWRSAYLEYENGIDVENIYIYTENIDEFGAQIYVEFNFVDYQNGDIAYVNIISPDEKIVGHTCFYVNSAKMVHRFDITEPQLWYPNGYGKQPIYKIVIAVGENLFEENFGIRTLKIIQIPDEKSSQYWNKACAAKQTDAGKKYDNNQIFSGFQVVINGKKIFCKGGNWVPCEPFPSAEDDKKIAKLVNMAKDMGANFLRVWGGGLFEKKAFYDECDKCGILVAQDFLMACGHYPEKEQWFIDALTKESEFAAKYLRNHPCLAWWHGDNENAIEGSDIQEDYIGRDSALCGIAPQIYKYDYTRQLLPSSPYGGDTYASITKGTSHTTNYLGMIFKYFDTQECLDYKEYLEQFVSRFISEEGTFGAIARPSMLKFMTEYDLLKDTDEEILMYHTKTNPGLKKHIFEYVKAFTKKILGDFKDGEDKFFKYKYIQYEWVRVAFENVRRNLGYCNGLIFWMFNDCWPAALGWSFVDYYLLPKHSYYAFSRGSKHIIGSIILVDDRYELVVSCDDDIKCGVDINAYLIKDGKICKTHSTSVLTNGYGTVTIELPWKYCSDFLIVCDLQFSEGSDRCFYKVGILELQPCDGLLDVIEKTENSITFKASGYIHAVELESETVFDDNCFSLLPQEIRTVGLKDSLGANGISIKAYTLNK